MTTNTRRVRTTPDRVWDVLSDGWLYPVWVVGASRMRQVEDDWPAVGSRIHHSIGLWPLLIDDNTEVTRSVPQQALGLRARGWPVGEAQVDITLEAIGDETEVTITERPVSGPGLVVPPPVRGVSLKWRNSETLRRLGYIAESRR